MSFDKPTRNRLAKFVADARRVIADEFTEQFQSLYGISAKGKVTALDRLGHLDEAGLATAALLRERIDYLEKTHPDDKDGTRAAVARLAREQAFTILNRLAAIRMAEKRDLIVESVGKGYQSRGFKVYETIAGSALGDAYHRYRRFLFCLFDELAIDLGILFDRRSPQALLFPREPALLALLDLLNGGDLEHLWAEDETIGWIYQYYNDPAERKKMRDESAAPRNSRELAVRNQFFTPRYVVEFLTDNTLGRIWYEMCQGRTGLKEQCRYLVRRPTEVFLGPGESAPDTKDEVGMMNDEKEGGEAADLSLHNSSFNLHNLSQEELLRAPVLIPHRPLKDPREIRLLDPACGSMHFGLYAFDLFETIYEEAWDMLNAHGGSPAENSKLKTENSRADSWIHQYASKQDYLRDVPKLIIENNLHGIDIDPRAVQIAGLSLWLRAQKAWQMQGVRPADRPRVLRSNIVCAEPMPGSPEMLEEFVKTLDPPLLGELVKTVFEKMELAGEAGSLLKIEEEIRTAIDAAKKAWEKLESKPRELFSTEELNKTTNQPELSALEQAVSSSFILHPSSFWESAEEQLIGALKAYAESADSQSYQRRLFADDAARGFAFIDLCRKRYDVAVMNPPFGISQGVLYTYLSRVYPDSFIDLLASFVSRGVQLAAGGYLGAITSRACLYTKTLLEWRQSQLSGRISTLIDLGIGVLDDAMVRACAYCVPCTDQGTSGIFIDGRKFDDKESAVKNAISDLTTTESAPKYACDSSFFGLIPQKRILYCLPRTFWESVRTLPAIEPTAATIRAGLTTYDDTRFLRLRWELNPELIGKSGAYMHLSKGGSFGTFYNDVHLTVLWAETGREVGAYNRSLYATDAQSRRGSSYYLRPAATYSRRTDFFSARALPSNVFFADKGPAIIPLEAATPELILGMFNSDLYRGLVHSQSQGGCFETGVLKHLPWHEPAQHVRERIEEFAKEAWLIKLGVFCLFETDARFIKPFEEFRSGPLTTCRDQVIQKITESNRNVAGIASRITAQVSELFGLSNDGFEDLDVYESDHDVKEARSILDDGREFAAAVLSYSLGTTLGRWDIRYATGALQPPPLPDPFDPLPVCPPGMLQGEDGLPLSKDELGRMNEEGEYPLRVTVEGILVDDENHPEDIVARVREAIEVIWGKEELGMMNDETEASGKAANSSLHNSSFILHNSARAESIEQEACEILGVRTLRDYFRRPSAFFADHLKRYSKSRRQAPIYWPLSTKSGSYTLWLYYHRLTDQTLHTCLADFLDPKIRRVQAELDALKDEGGRLNYEGKNAGELRDFLDELKDLHDEIERVIKLPWRPNLNDGVLITASPLHKLFRLPKWQKDLKACWDKLAKGDYDWAHLAYTIWPTRVEKACERDRSIAIAHNREDLCKVEAPKPKKKRAKKKGAEEDAELELMEED